MAVQVDLALEPGAQAHLLVTGRGADNTLKLSDVRMAGAHQQQQHGQGDNGTGEARMGVWKTISCEMKGRMTALTAHASAPLIAAGSSHQVCRHAYVRIKKVSHFICCVDIQMDIIPRSCKPDSKGIICNVYMWTCRYSHRLG